MKAKITTIYLFFAFSILVFTGCQNEGTPGPAGLDGQNAAVYYSEWFTPSVWSGNSGDWYFDASAPDLTTDVVDNGVILAYVLLAGDIYSNTVRPLPAFAVGANWSFLVYDYGIIQFTCDMNIAQMETGDSFRFIAIPGTDPTLKSASLKNKSAQELRNMPYKDVCKLFNIPE